MIIVQKFLRLGLLAVLLLLHSTLAARCPMLPPQLNVDGISTSTFLVPCVQLSKSKRGWVNLSTVSEKEGQPLHHWLRATTLLPCALWHGAHGQ